MPKKYKYHLSTLASKNRKTPTEAEKKIWNLLKNNQMECRFRRQHQIGNYIVDFICLDKKLIIEIDGGQHDESVLDIQRTEFLNSEGFKVIRFWNNEVLNNIEGVYEVITKNL